MNESLRFIQTNQIKTIDYTNLHALKGPFEGLFSCGLRKKESTADVSTTYYSIILLSQVGVGHVDFISRRYPQGSITECDYGYLWEFMGQGLPAQIDRILPDISGSNALEVVLSEQGKRIGSLLWMLGCCLLQLEKISEVRIWDTTDLGTRKTSFYSRWGAIQGNDEAKWTSTTLSREQIELAESAGFDTPAFS